MSNSEIRTDRWNTGLRRLVRYEPLDNPFRKTRFDTMMNRGKLALSTRKLDPYFPRLSTPGEDRFSENNFPTPPRSIPPLASK